MWMEGLRLAGIGVIGEGDVLVTSTDGQVFGLDADGEELRSLKLYVYDISRIEVWGDIMGMGLVLSNVGKIRMVELAESDGNYRIARLGNYVGGGVGTGDGELLFPTNMVKGDGDRLFVVNAGMGRIDVFKDGEYLTKFGRPGRGPGEFTFREGDVYLGDVAVDSSGNVYVADTGNGRIQKFGP